MASSTRLLAIPTLRGHEMHTNALCIFNLTQAMKQWSSQVSLLWALGHAVSEQRGKIPFFPLLITTADNWCDTFHPGGTKIHDVQTPLSPLTSAGSQKTQRSCSTPRRADH